MRNAKKVLARTSVSFAVLAGICGGAAATENYDLRYAPGIGGADMSAPADPGTYFQIPLYVYSAEVKTTTSTSQSVSAAPPNGLGVPGAVATASVRSKVKLQVVGVMPRITYISTTQFLGATVGATALLPILQKKADASASVASPTFASPFVPGLDGAVSPAAREAVRTRIQAGATAIAEDESSKKFGVGDLEIAPVFRWNRDPDQILFVPTVILPTGGYSKDRTANPGAGKFYTFRPSVQYSHIGEGFDFGARLSFSMNTKNDDTHYRSGNYVNFDMSFMKSLNDAWRVGMAAYAVVQTTKDVYTGEAADITVGQSHTVGKRGQVFAAGPSVAWIKGAGEMLLEGRILKEFSAVDRPEGTALWLNFAMPLQ